MHFLLWKENEVLASAGVWWQLGVLWTVEMLEAMKRLAGRGEGVEVVWGRVLKSRRDSGEWRGFAASAGGKSVFVVGKEDLDEL